MAVEDDARPRLFVLAKEAVMIQVEQLKNCVVRGFAVTVFEHLDVRVFGDAAVDAFRELDWPVVQVVVPHKSTHKPDHDARR